ncbi:TerB family tellurite resistance protein [Aquimarina sp. MMG015]|uniref:tellurite resistance TerB family protein n=1 Tax=Aquimarina TaxID=290174 RepID=UPI0003FE288B|nr:MULTISPECIES: TerB family tellurite resistance protein [Aquimarina]AXT57449.1 TerB family tellurite resistance protein [Aquimarina sp. AD1]MBQ4801305.1 TerB family tellurite resistance protein [Aquimarina sp. MMG015]RKN13473.1 TerB family tellurite resistance protein [Aquimarina sp. AD1]
MVSRDRLYQTFGELLYVIAMSDGVIEKEEVHTLEEILKAHPKGQEIKWSFDYENANDSDIETLYKRVIEVFSDNGPDEEYDFMIYALTKIAEAKDGIGSKEEKVINSFSKDLLERFKKDIDNLFNS